MIWSQRSVSRLILTQLLFSCQKLQILLSQESDFDILPGKLTRKLWLLVPNHDFWHEIMSGRKQVNVVMNQISTASVFNTGIINTTGWPVYPLFAWRPSRGINNSMYWRLEPLISIIYISGITLGASTWRQTWIFGEHNYAQREFSGWDLDLRVIKTH